MIGFENYVRNIFELLKKHKFLSFLMVVFVFISLMLLGFTVDMQQTTEKTATDYQEAYGQKTFFYTGEALSDTLYYRYMEENNDKDFRKLLDFKDKLIHSDSFLYTEMMDQPVEMIDSEIPEVCLVNYESGDAENSMYEYDGGDIYATKALEVSSPFFQEFSIETMSGNVFSEEDYSFDGGKEIPVLAGNAYQEDFKVGDTFEGYYLFEKKTFVIKDFIKKQSFFYSRGADDFISCERYLILPSLQVKDATKFSKLLLLQQMTGMISSALGYEQTQEIYDQYLKDTGMEGWDIYIVNPDAETASILDSYSAMTNEVARQFNIMVIIILTFGCVAMITVICGMLKENHFTFGVSLLCGASFRDVALEAVGLAGSILLLGNFFAVLALLIQRTQLVSFLTIQAVVVLIAMISCTACVLYLRRMDVSDIIGGKE